MGQDKSSMTPSSHATDYPGLLPPGLHFKTLVNLRELCVTPFQRSSTRPNLMDSLESACKRLIDASLPIDLWVDGSFLTEKLDPRDVDLVARVPGHVYNSSSQAMRDALTWFTDDTRQDDLSLDDYEFADHPENSPMYPMACD